MSMPRLGIDMDHEGISIQTGSRARCLFDKDWFRHTKSLEIDANYFTPNTEHAAPLGVV